MNTSRELGPDTWSTACAAMADDCPRDGIRARERDHRRPQRQRRQTPLGENIIRSNYRHCPTVHGIAFAPPEPAPFPAMITHENSTLRY